jgi:hypothetical protein
MNKLNLNKMGYTEADIDRMINEVLDEFKDCRDLPYVCSMIQTPFGRKRIFDYVKKMVLEQGMTNIDAILDLIQFTYDWPQQD